MLEFKTFAFDELSAHLANADEKKRLTVEPKITYWNGLPHVYDKRRHDYYFVVALLRNETGQEHAVGIIELQLANEPNVIWLMSIGVAEKYQQKGVATLMCEELCRFLKSTTWQLQSSTPTETGEKYVVPMLSRLIVKHGVAVIPSQKQLFSLHT